MEENIQLTDGSPITPEHREINPETGMQKGYVVLAPEERAKGFVRPLRTEYKHTGKRPKYSLRELTAEERERYSQFHYVGFEEYPESESPLVGRYWTEKDLNSGCNTITKMGLSIAETYARNPKFYGGTFCCQCRGHFSLEEFTWLDGSQVGS